MPDRAFVDTNVWIYLFVASESPADTPKRKAAGDLLGTLDARGDVLIVSAQVLNEFVSVLSRKHRFKPALIRPRVQHILGVADVVPLTPAHTLAPPQGSSPRVSESHSLCNGRSYFRSVGCLRVASPFILDVLEIIEVDFKRLART